MGLFDHLFKPRPEGSVERVVEAPLKASSFVERRADADGETPPDPATAFLHPKGYAPGSATTTLGGQNQGFVPVLPAAKRAAPERKTHHAEDPAVAANLVVLTIGDVLARIPGSFLRPGPHDLKRELRFHFEDLAADITRGRPAIALSCIAEQCPDLFHSPITDADDMAIRLPLQKLVEQAARLRPHAPMAPPTVMPPPARPPVAAPVEKRPAETPIPAPAASVPSVASVPSPVEPPTLTPAPAAPPLPTPVVLAPPMPVPLAPPPPEKPAEPAPEPPVEPAAPIPEPPPVAREPIRSAKMAPPGSTIDLSLSALLAKVPREMLAGPLPHIDESYRITLPFPMIERQLGAGRVEIPARLFWNVLPPLLKHHFHARDDLVMQLPLEEIFQNLPVGGAVERPRFEATAPPAPHEPDLAAPIILAPAPHDDATPELDLDLPPRPAAPIPADAKIAEPPAAEPPAPEPAPITAAPIAAEAKTAEPPAPEPTPIAAVPIAEAAAIPAPKLPEEILLAAIAPVEISEPKISVPEPPPEVTAPSATSAVSVSAASAAPDDESPAFVQLQPFRAFAPPPRAVEPEPASDPTEVAPVTLGAAPASPVSPAETLHILRPAAEPAVEREVEASTANVEAARQATGASSQSSGEGEVPSVKVTAAEEPAVTPAPVQAVPSSEPAEAAPPHLTVLPPPDVAPPAPEVAPAPEPAPLVRAPEPETLVAFSADQPPPLKIEAPAAAVAELRATVPAPQEEPAIGMATASVQPPPMFRPVVLAPRVAGFTSTTPVNLAPTLAGPSAPAAGMISLAPAVELAQPAPTPPVSTPSAPPPPEPASIAAPVEDSPLAEPAAAAPEPPPAAHREPAPTLKNLVRRFFPSSLAVPAPETPAVPSPAEPPPAPLPEARQMDSIPTPPVAPAPPPIPAPTPSPSAATAEPPAPFHLPLPPLPKTAPATPPAPQHAPPALPISRFDQHSLQALFMTEETLDLPKISRLAAALPGLQACTIVARGETFSSGLLPEGFHLNALRGLSPQVGAAADRLPIGELKNFTLYGEQYSISFFERPAVCLCAIHRARSFIPGVREKLVAVVDELARG